MKNKYIVSLIVEVQLEYLTVLKNIREIITKDNIYLLMDELKHFWIKRENKIEFIIESILDKSNITYLTTATVLDLSDGDQYPFLLCGEYHIFDDPLFSHLETANQKLDKYSDFIYEKAILSINDNIEIIEKYSAILWVIPIRLLYSQINQQQLKENMENIFVSMFDGIGDISEYFSKCESIEDIEKYFKTSFVNAIHLTSRENNSMTLSEKINLVKQEKSVQKLGAPNDAVMFFITLGGLIGQAIDIIYTSVASRLIPYIRYDPSYYTIMSIIGNFSKTDKEFSDLENKITKYHLVSYFFENDDFMNFDLFLFSDTIEKLGIRQKIDTLIIDINQQGSLKKYHTELNEILNTLKDELTPPIPKRID